MHGKRLPLIINVRGNSGSGKTHLTCKFMNLCKATPVKNFEGKIVGYQGLYQGKVWYFLGRYESACGGCDTIKTQLEVVQQVDSAKAVRVDGIWLEGLIMSTIYGTVGEYSEQFGDRWVFAYLDTPEEVCFQRIRARRKAAGNTKPLNEKNTANRFATIVRNREIVLSKGRRVVVLNYKQALPQLLKIIKKEA